MKHKIIIIVNIIVITFVVTKFLTDDFKTYGWVEGKVTSRTGDYANVYCDLHHSIHSIKDYANTNTYILHVPRTEVDLLFIGLIVFISVSFVIWFIFRKLV